MKLNTMAKLFLVLAIALLASACGDGDDNGDGTAGNPPSAPTGLTAQAGDQEVTLNWQAVSDADTYVVLRATASGGAFTVIGEVPATSFVDSEVANDTTYFYVVQAANASGTSGFSNEASATPTAPGGAPVPAPGPPAALTATAGDAEVTLSWDRAPGAFGYRVFRAVRSGGPYQAIAEVPATGFVDTAVENGVRYFYRVTALNRGGSSGFSNEASATPRADVVPQPPPAPEELRSVAGDQRVFLSWSSAAGAEGYRVFARTSENGFTLIAEVDSTAFTHTGLTNGQTYFYVVRAVNDAGVSGASNEVQATPRAEALVAPPPPLNVEAEVEAGLVEITWDAAEDALRYIVSRAREGEALERIAITQETRFMDGPLEPGTYQYVIQAENEAGVSAPSQAAIVEITEDNTPPEGEGPPEEVPMP